MLSKIIFTVVLLALSGCTSFEPYLRPGLSIQYLPPGSANGAAIIDTLGNDAPFKCILRSKSLTESIGNTFSSSQKEPKDCLYGYVEFHDMKNLLSLDQSGKEDDKKTLVRFISSLTDQNCKMFLSRMFANREGLTFWQKLFNDFGSAAAGATAFATPYAAMGISIGSITLNNGMDAASATYFQSAEDALETAITTKMASDEQAIEAKLDTPDSYPIMIALAQLADLGRDCTIDQGLHFLTAAAKSAGTNNKDAGATVGSGGGVIAGSGAGAGAGIVPHADASP